MRLIFFPQFAFFANWGTKGAKRNELAYSKPSPIPLNLVILERQRRIPESAVLDMFDMRWEELHTLSVTVVHALKRYAINPNTSSKLRH
jgi:hypothetical protein